MVQARLDAEGADGKRVLRAAAIFGQRFSRAGLAALLGDAAGIEEVSDAVERLAAHELVARASTPAREGDVEFVFAHALVREAAYAMLTDEDRLLGHRLAGGWLEAAGATDAMVMAEHFRRGGEPARAVRWYERAAAQALSANDLGAAIGRAELGIEGGAAGELAGNLRLIAAEAHVWRGRAGRGGAAGPGGGRRSPVRRRPAWLRALAQAIIAAGKHGRLEVVERQVALVEASPLTAEPTIRSARISCLAWGANFLVFGGRHAVADPLIVTIGALAGERDAALDPRALGLLHQVRAVRASAAGDLGRCLTGLESALQSFEQAGDLRNACAVRTNLGYLYSELGDHQRAEAALRQALLASDRMGLFDLSAAALHNLGRVLGCGAEAGRGRAAGAAGGRSVRPSGRSPARGAGADLPGRDPDRPTRLRGRGRGRWRRLSPRSLSLPRRRSRRSARWRGRASGRGIWPAASPPARDAHLALERLGEIEEGESMVRLTYAEALAAAGEQDQADAALATARERLLARADRVADPGWRHRFLHEVPVNARIPLPWLERHLHPRREPAQRRKRRRSRRAEASCARRSSSREGVGALSGFPRKTV